MSGPRRRVVLVDDHEMVRAGLKSMLSRFPDDVRVVGEAATAAEGFSVVTGLLPDVVLTDVRIGADSGLDLCRRLTAAQCASRVLFLTVYDDEQYLFQALRAGAAGYLIKRVTGAELVAHVHAVCSGEVVVDPTLAGRIAVSAARMQAGEFWPGAHLGLTQRESEVLALMVAGLSNRAVAARLVVGEETVKSHVRGIYRKLGVGDRATAVGTALREGLYQ
ncbi:MAG: response regulator transcription factor [Geodermatophilaceae bacterium]|nr:response regulator transcription factor [Geodermatophilaceae bacterium]MDQ3455357.1 response regulator transcription factor [Actinomycetota bacterium]